MILIEGEKTGDLSTFNHHQCTIDESKSKKHKISLKMIMMIIKYFKQKLPPNEVFFKFSKDFT